MSSGCEWSFISLFWALSLSPVWPNIECQQDLGYETNFFYFYSENNSDSLNRPPSTNLIVMQCQSILYNTCYKLQMLKYLSFKLKFLNKSCLIVRYTLTYSDEEPNICINQIFFLYTLEPFL